MRLLLEETPTPIGKMWLVTDETEAIFAMDFEEYEGRMRRLLGRYFGRPELVHATRASSAAVRLRAYFDGDLAAFDGARLAFGGTEFQRATWSGLRKIPAGTTTTYGDLARAIGRPAAVRAVGAANGANPIVIAVPCHRVIGFDGSLTGYGGGLERKRFLLDHESGARDMLTQKPPLPPSDGTVGASWPT